MVLSLKVNTFQLASNNSCKHSKNSLFHSSSAFLCSSTLCSSSAFRFSFNELRRNGTDKLLILSGSHHQRIEQTNPANRATWTMLYFVELHLHSAFAILDSRNSPRSALSFVRSLLSFPFLFSFSFLQVFLPLLFCCLPCSLDVEWWSSRSLIASLLEAKYQSSD